jgi:hypothetical protein
MACRPDLQVLGIPTGFPVVTNNSITLLSDYWGPDFIANANFFLATKSMLIWIYV